MSDAIAFRLPALVRKIRGMDAELVVEEIDSKTLGSVAVFRMDSITVDDHMTRRIGTVVTQPMFIVKDEWDYENDSPVDSGTPNVVVHDRVISEHHWLSCGIVISSYEETHCPTCGKELY